MTVPCAGAGRGEGRHGHQSVHEAAEESPGAGAGEEEAAGQRGQDGGAGPEQGDTLDSILVSRSSGASPLHATEVLTLFFFKGLRGQESRL